MTNKHFVCISVTLINNNGDDDDDDDDDDRRLYYLNTRITQVIFL